MNKPKIRKLIHRLVNLKPCEYQHGWPVLFHDTTHDIVSADICGHALLMEDEDISPAGYRCSGVPECNQFARYSPDINNDVRARAKQILGAGNTREDEWLRIVLDEWCTKNDEHFDISAKNAARVLEHVLTPEWIVGNRPWGFIDERDWLLDLANWLEGIPEERFFPGVAELSFEDLICHGLDIALADFGCWLAVFSGRKNEHGQYLREEGAEIWHENVTEKMTQTLEEIAGVADLFARLDPMRSWKHHPAEVLRKGVEVYD